MYYFTKKHRSKRLKNQGQSLVIFLFGNIISKEIFITINSFAGIVNKTITEVPKGNSINEDSNEEPVTEATKDDSITKDPEKDPITEDLRR